MFSSPSAFKKKRHSLSPGKPATPQTGIRQSPNFSAGARGGAGGGAREPFLKGSLPRFHIHTLLFLSRLHTLNVFNFLLLGLFGELAEDEHIDAAAFGRLKGKFGTREGAVPARITERTKT